MRDQLVSVLIPMRNAGPWIGAALKSVCDQTWSNIEVIVVDDGSSDDSNAIVRSLQTSRIRLIAGTAQGAAAARNVARREAQGDYIQYLDADDLLSPDKISAQVRLLRDAGNRVAICRGVQFVDGTDPTRGRADTEKNLLETDDPSEFLVNLWGGRDGICTSIPCHAHLVPRALSDQVGEWDEDLVIDQDGEYFARVAARSEGIRVARDVTVYYRRHPKAGSVSARRGSAAYHSRLAAIESKGRELLVRRSDDFARHAVGILYMNLAVNSYPMHREITDECLRALRELHVSPQVPVLGGFAISWLSRVMGWKSARRLQFWKHQMGL